MPKVTVTQNAGDSPIIQGSASRTFLMVQNNTLVDVRYRLIDGVHLTLESKTGMLLAKAPQAGLPGGAITLTGAAAQRPFFAIHAGSPGDTVKLDVETDG